MITDFITKKMSGYIVGGMKPETAAYFTCGELEAIYKGNHYSRDKSGAMRVTPPPESLHMAIAMRKADAAIKEILKGKNKALKNKPLTQDSLSGFEKMAEYARTA